jgi:flagellin
MPIARLVENVHKVLRGCADESSGKCGSFHKVTRSRRLRRLSGQAPAAGTHWIISTGTRRNCMSLGVLNNISAIYAQNNLANTQTALQKTLQQLSSGSRINSGSDDAAGLSLANGLQASSTALSQSAKNASEGVDFLQVGDGALSQITSLLNRAVTLATEAANGTLNTTQQQAADAEYQKILTEIETINDNTEYNGIHVFNAATTAAYAGTDPNGGVGAVTQGAAGTGLAIFTSDGKVSTTYNDAATDLIAADVKTLGLQKAGGNTDLLSAANAKTALTAVTGAIATVAGDRGTIGANINTLSAVGNVMSMQSTNTLAAMNDVTATDYGQATSDMSKYQILSQTGIAALSQANQAQQLITKLLQ